MQALISPGVAADTPLVQAKLEAKFPQRSIPVQNRGGSVPDATAAEVLDFIKQVQGFKVGTGPGPSGLRVQFIKELIGEDGDDACVEAVFRLLMFFVEGKVPDFLGPWYGGGTLVGIGKDDKPLD